jgi:hypothetical protein
MISLLASALLMVPPIQSADTVRPEAPPRQTARADFLLPKNLRPFRSRVVIVYDLEGGHVGLQLTRGTPALIGEARAYLKAVGDSLAKGELQTYFGPNSLKAPGAKLLTEKTALFRVRYRDLPWGGELNIVSREDDVSRAITQFLRAVNRRTPS